MEFELTTNAKALLLLTAPLIVGRRSEGESPLTHGEYKKLFRRLTELDAVPADFFSTAADQLIRDCSEVVPERRLRSLLGRGLLLSQVVEKWHSRAIWVTGKGDDLYPQRLEVRLGEEAPSLIYGCGDAGLVDYGGLAVVGSRHVSSDLMDYTIAVGELCAGAGKAVVSGGAKGIDQAAMRGVLEAGGRTIGVLADSLERSALKREHREVLLDGRMVLISPYDPNAGFNVGNAMQRNKLIYALSDAALVVNSDLRKGGTWAGAVEQLEKLRLVPVYVRSTGEATVGLEALQNKGAMEWPNPKEPNELDRVFSSPAPCAPVSTEELSLFAEGDFA